MPEVGKKYGQHSPPRTARRYGRRRYTNKALEDTEFMKPSEHAYL